MFFLLFVHPIMTKESTKCSKNEFKFIDKLAKMKICQFFFKKIQF